MKAEIERIILAHGRIVHQAGHDWFKEMAAQAAAEIAKLCQGDVQRLLEAADREVNKRLELEAQLAEMQQALYEIAEVPVGGKTKWHSDAWIKVVKKVAKKTLASAPKLLWSGEGKFECDKEIGVSWVDMEGDVEAGLQIREELEQANEQRVRVTVTSAEEEG